MNLNAFGSSLDARPSRFSTAQMASKDEKEERRTPRSRACASCRASKHRCDGEEGGISCSRCARNRRECVWPAPQKMGRPRRSAATGDTNSPPVLTPDAPYNSRGLDSSSSSNSQSPASSTPWSDSNRTQDGGDFDSASPGTNIANSSSPSQSHHDFHVGDSRNSPDSGMISSQSEILQLIDTFYSIPHTYIPILPSKEEFLANFPRHPPLLVNALLALASQYASVSTKDYRKIALTLLSATAPPSENSFDAVNYVRALLLLTYLEYGMAAISQACQLCQKACSLAVSLGWNYLDARQTGRKRSLSRIW
ncbi:hypothetical protein BS47DRAFT_433041 [Hydnum rufescens UP504]|uniref:Zn(2)-C6 fungal-type domain-containing protein n=1 Tax=Hydnum rufescens UP504 TaxID=1448309 RepID=A0A9P6AIG1_9AGAM|nr:hypothetical protein BS47DRAFT_433041 [Hydnum rufescens UP504]